jgi:hypothetical protein
VNDHPALPEIERLLPPPASEEARLITHILRCREGRQSALGVLRVPPPSRHEQFLACFDQIDEHLDDVEALLAELVPEDE